MVDLEESCTLQSTVNKNADVSFLAGFYACVGLTTNLEKQQQQLQHFKNKIYPDAKKTNQPEIELLSFLPARILEICRPRLNAWLKSNLV